MTSSSLWIFASAGVPVGCETHEIGYRQRDLYNRKLGDGRLVNLLSRLNHGEHVGRGTAFGDLDDDGRFDVVVSNLLAINASPLYSVRAPANAMIRAIENLLPRFLTTSDGRPQGRPHRLCMLKTLSRAGHKDTDIRVSTS